MAAVIPRGPRALLSSLGGDLREFAFPQLCPGCGGRADPARPLCDACVARIPRLAAPLCARCLARGRSPASCARHQAHVVWAAWLYDERAALVVHALKFGARPRLAQGLGEVLSAAVPPAPRWDLVLDVPLHAARRRERGYNQAGLLADSVSRVSGVPRLAGALERRRATRPQSLLRPEERRLNVADAFRVRRPEWLRGRNVLIVDDVMTTGATLEACLDVLAKAGARAAGVALAWAQ